MSNPFINMEWIPYIGDHLPADWEIQVCVRRMEAEIKLIDPDGDELEFCDDDLDTTGMLQLRVDYARISDGLEPHWDFTDAIDYMTGKK